MTPPFWDSLEATKIIRSYAQALANLSLFLLAGFEILEHWHNNENVKKRSGALAIVALVSLVVFDVGAEIYGSRWETLQQKYAELEIKAANDRAQAAENAVNNLPKPIVLAPLTARNFKLSERWGRKALVSNVTGNSGSFTFTITQ